MDCCGTGVLDQKFDARRAAADLQRYHRRGPVTTTRLMLRGLKGNLPGGATLLDIGGGIGVLHLELLARGVSRAWEVEPSAAFVRTAREEAARRGFTGRVEFINAELRQAAGGLPMADVVTMDRVVCCDPDYESLLRIALGRARRLFAFSHPRAHLATRGVNLVQNAVRRLRGSDFRVFVHPPERMDAQVRAAGFERVYVARSPAWSAAVYVRRAEAAAPSI